MKKAERYMGTSKMKKEIDKLTDDIMLGRIQFSGKNMPKTPEDAAIKFIEVLSKEIEHHVGEDYRKGQFSELAHDVLKDLKYGDPYRVGDEYFIDVYFDTDLHRESLMPNKYDGIDNIAALLNKGYSAKHAVHGYWTNHKGVESDEKIFSLTKRSGAHFVEQAINDFMGNYSSEYNVWKIIPSKEYQIRTET